MKSTQEYFFGFMFLIWWFAGIFVSKGISTLICLIFPPYAMYLLTEAVILKYNLL